MKNKTLSHRQVLQLAIPMIISNISTPLLGLVDTAVMGHLDSAQFLAAVALGSLIFSFIYWGFGFLRMGTTGLTAQAYGEKNDGEIKAILLRAMVIAWIIAGLVLLIKQPLTDYSFSILQSSLEVERMAAQYFDIRIWSAPATFSLYVLMGWFLGMQNVKSPLFVVLITNLVNIALDIVLVSHWKMGVAGVALASVAAEYLGLLTAVILLRKQWLKLKCSEHNSKLFDYRKFKALLMINGNIFLRTWCLIFAFAFFTAQGARFGDVILAANAVLLNFQNFMAYALDGFAYSAEALVGRAVGEKNPRLLYRSVKIAGQWSFIIACYFAGFYAFFGYQLIDLLTGLNSVREQAYIYLPWLIAMPIVSFICYLFDGVFIGAMLSRQMRNSMLFSLLLCFLPTWYFSQHFANQGLWLAMTVFMIARGVSMGWIYKRTVSKGQILRFS